MWEILRMVWFLYDMKRYLFVRYILEGNEIRGEVIVDNRVFLLVCMIIIFCLLVLLFVINKWFLWNISVIGIIFLLVEVVGYSFWSLLLYWFVSFILFILKIFFCFVLLI